MSRNQPVIRKLYKTLSERVPEDKPFLPVIRYAVIFFTLLGTSLAACIFYFRLPFGSPPAAGIAKCILILSASLFLWQEIAARCSGGWPAVGALLGLFLPCFALGPIASWLLVAGLSVVVGWGCVTAVRQLPSYSTAALLTLLAAPALGVGYFLFINSSREQNVFLPEFVLVGEAGTDALYHAAIASMVAYHGVVSTGLDGLVLHHYHFLSHVWIGLTARWLQVPTIHGYYLVPQIIGVPLFLFALCVSFVEILRIRVTSFDPPSLVLLPLIILGVFDFGNWNSYLISASQLLGLIILFLGFTMIFRIIKHPNKNYIYFFAIIFGAVLSAAKISIGFVWFASLGYVSLRQYLENFTARFYAFLILLVPVALFVLYFVKPAGYEPFSDPLVFFHDYPFVFLVNGIAIGLGVVVGFIQYRSASREYRIIIEVLVIGCLISILATLALQLGSSQFYILDIGTKLAVVLLATYAVSLSFMQFRNAIVGLLVLLLIGTWGGSYEKRQSWTTFSQLVAYLVAAMRSAVEPAALDVTPKTTEAAITSVAQSIGDTPGKRAFRFLRSQVGYGTSDVVIFVPPSNRDFWRITEACISRAFFVPAMLAVPMIDGVPPSDGRCDGSYDRFYGFDYYGKASVSTEVDDRTLCLKARGLNFGSIFIMTAISEGRWLRCRPDG